MANGGSHIGYTTILRIEDSSGTDLVPPYTPPAGEAAVGERLLGSAHADQVEVRLSPEPRDAGVPDEFVIGARSAVCEPRFDTVNQATFSRGPQHIVVGHLVDSVAE
jgi:hypothetical protein